MSSASRAVSAGSAADAAASAPTSTAPAEDAASQTTPQTIPQTLWDLQVPLYITHAGFPSPGDAGAPPPFVTSVPRFSYLAFLLPRLGAYFGRPCSSFHHEDVLLRNLAVGLLADLYRPALPWRLVVSHGTSWDIGDTFLNSAKEVRLLFGTINTARLWLMMAANVFTWR